MTEHISIKEQLDEMRVELKKMSADILELTIINKHTYKERQSNSLKLERMENDFNSAKGAITLLKGVLSIVTVAIISFCTWIVTSNQAIQSQLHQTSERIALSDERINNIKLELEQLERNRYVYPSQN